MGPQRGPQGALTGECEGPVAALPDGPSEGLDEHLDPAARFHSTHRQGERAREPVAHAALAGEPRTEGRDIHTGRELHDAPGLESPSLRLRGGHGIEGHDARAATSLDE